MSRRLIQGIKASNALCVVYVNTVDTKIKAHNALNRMFVNTVDTGICGFYTTLYTEYCNEVSKVYSTLYARPLTPPGGKAT